MFKQFLILLVAAMVLAIAVNFVSPNAIPVVGDYRDLTSSGDPVVPPSAEPGDPPFIDLQQAQLDHQLGTALFVDARGMEEFECGTIPGSINIPFEEMPDGDLTGYLDSALSEASFDRPIIVFCSGEECDLSLHLGRFLYSSGYTRVAIFFGGAREWEQAGLEVERRMACGE